MASHDELFRIKSLHAFNIPQAERKLLNQHATRYTFKDGSILIIRATTSQGIAYDPRGNRISSHKLLINKQGKGKGN